MNPKTSQDLFNKIRSQFSNIQVGDESGVPTADPSSAVFFEFEFKEDADTYGAVSVSLADGENMKVFYNRDLVDKIDEDSKDEWYAFLKELKDFAVEHQLAFDVRDITKSNLTKQDYQNIADTNKTVNTDEMSEELNRITNLAGVKEAPIDRGAPADKGRPAEPEAGLTGGVAPTTIAKQFPGVDDKSSLVRAVTKMKSGESNYTRDEITAAADAFKEILAKDPKETSRLMTMLKGVAQKANPFNHPDDWVGHGMMKNKAANAKGKGRGTGDDRRGTVWGTDMSSAESVNELERITKLAGVNEVSDMGMNKYGLAAKHIGGKFYSFRHGKQTGGPFDSAEELAKHQQELIKDESLAEGLTGTARRSYEDLEKTRLIVRHSGKVDEEIPGSRSRHIESLYIENEDGERFKYPLTHLAGARAMQRHVANGGRPHDEFGEHIVKTSEDIAKLNSFSRYVSHKDQLNDNAGDIIEKTKLQLENLREYIRNISKQPHYDAASKDFKTSEEIVLDDETIAKLREKFTMKNLDNRVEDALPLINNIMSELEAPKEEQPVTELDPGEEPIDAPVEPAVDHAMIVKQFLANPDSKIMLNKNMPDEKKFNVPKASPEDARIMTTLSDIASRMLTKTPDEDRVANFASRVADQMSKTGMPFDPEDPDANKNRDIAKALVAKYDKASQEIDPGDFNPKKHPKLDKRARGETAEFEDWVDNTVNPKESMPDMQDDRAQVAQDMWNKNKDLQAQYKTWQDFLNSEDFEEYVGHIMSKYDWEAAEGTKFEDIKPFIEQHLKEGGDKTTAIKTAIENFNADKLKESRGKIVESIKAKADGHAQDIAGVEGEVERIAQLANYQN